MSGINIKILKNDELIHDCTLCKDSSGQAGWYDGVGGTFHPMSNASLAQEPLWGQYIDTGVGGHICFADGLTHSQNSSNQWISVKQQRPRYKEKVLFADLVGEVHFATDSLDWDDGHVVFYVPTLDKWLRGDLWMPMPRPPKEEA